MRFVIDSTDDARRARRVLAVLVWVPVTLTLLTSGLELAQRMLWEAQLASDGGSRDASWWLMVIGHGGNAVRLAAFVTLGVAALRLRLRVRWLATTTAAAFAVLIMLEVAFQVAYATLSFETANDLWLPTAAIRAGSWVLLGATLFAAGPRGRIERGLLALAAVIPVGMLFLYAAGSYFQALATSWFAEHATAWWLLTSAIDLTQAIALCLLARRAAAPLPEPTAEDDWRAAARGLRLFGHAVVARVVIVFCFVLLLVFAALSRSWPLVNMTLVVLPLASIVTGAVAIGGMGGFAHLPYLDGVRRAARAALVLLIAAVLLESYDLQVALTAAIDRQHLFDLDLRLARQVELAGQLAGLAAVILVLVALRAVGRHIARPELAATATALIGPVLLITGGGIGLRHYAGGGSIEPDLGAMLMLLAAIANIVVTLMFAKTAHRVAAAMGESPVPSRARASYRESTSG